MTEHLTASHVGYRSGRPYDLAFYTCNFSQMQIILICFLTRSTMSCKKIQFRSSNARVLDMQNLANNSAYLHTFSIF